MTVFLFTLASIAAWRSVSELAPLFTREVRLRRGLRPEDQLRQGILIVRTLQDRLESGQFPDTEEWNRLSLIPAPWGSMFHATLMEARDRGAPVVPTLKRMQSILEDQVSWLGEARAKIAPAQGQALLSLVLVPVFSAILYLMLPGIENHGLAYLGVCWVGFLLGLGAYCWMNALGENARFGNLPRSKRSWISSAMISVERLNALVQVGLPPDLAWSQTLQELQRLDSELALHWGSLVWESNSAHSSAAGRLTVENGILSLGIEIKRLIQTSLIEGQGVLERLEALQRNWSSDLRSRILKELAELGNASLKPLFLFVFPAIVLVMAAGFYFSLEQML